MPAWIYLGVLAGFAVMFRLSTRTFDQSPLLSMLMCLATGFLFGYLLLW